jgi:hypothetical protein
MRRETPIAANRETADSGVNRAELMEALSRKFPKGSRGEATAIQNDATPARKHASRHLGSAVD